MSAGAVVVIVAVVVVLAVAAIVALLRRGRELHVTIDVRDAGRDPPDDPDDRV